MSSWFADGSMAVRMSGTPTTGVVAIAALVLDGHRTSERNRKRGLFVCLFFGGG